MAVVTICSDFGAQENKVCHCFHCFPIYLPWSDGTGCHDLRFLNVEFFLIFTLFYFTILYWFCHTSTWIRHGCTWVPNPEPSSHPIPSLWVVPVHQPQASCIMHQTWTADSLLIWYYTCFNAILPNHPTLSLSHRVQKTVLYICVSFAVSHTGLSLPSF